MPARKGASGSSFPTLQVGRAEFHTIHILLGACLTSTQSGSKARVVENTLLEDFRASPEGIKRLGALFCLSLKHISFKKN